MIGGDGKSVKDHVDGARNEANGADASAHENSDKIEELDGRGPNLEADTEQPHASASIMAFMEQKKRINSDFVSFATLTKAAVIRAQAEKEKRKVCDG
jgi:hypothetical protein